MMKRLMLTAFVALFAFVAQAQMFSIVSGDPSVFKQKGKTANVVLDYKDAKRADLSKKVLEDVNIMDFLKENDPKVYNNWDKHMEECLEWFCDRWNNEKKTFVKVLEEGKGDYVIKIHADYLDFGNVAAAMWSFNKHSGGVMVRGTFSIEDQEGNTLCVVKLNDFRGQSDRTISMKYPTAGRRLALFHKGLAKDMTGFLLNQ
jgi:hypothetical protein